MGKDRKYLTDEEWAPIGQDYCSGVSVNKLSQKYNISRPAIDKAVKRFNWHRDPLMQEAIAAQTREELQNRMRVASAATAEAPATRIGRDRADLIQSHQIAWDNIYELREDAFRLLRGEPTKRLAEPLKDDIIDPVTLKVVEKGERLTLNRRINWAAKLLAMFETDARAMMTAQEGERRAYGFDYKSQLEDAGVNADEERRKRELARSLISMVKQLKEGGGKPPPAEAPVIEGEIV